MKKFFLIPLMALFSCVMAWGATVQVGTYAELQAAISTANDDDVIEFTADIAYPANPQDYLNITKSISIEGQNHTLSGNSSAGATLRVNRKVDNPENVVITISDLTIINPTSDKYGIAVNSSLGKLTLNNCEIYTTNGNGHCVLLGGPAPASKSKLELNNTHLYAGTGGYPIRMMCPTEITMNNSSTKGYCSVYFERAANGFAGAQGARGSSLHAYNCNFDAPNVHSGGWNDFSAFPMYDDGISIVLENCGINAENLGNAGQVAFEVGVWTPKDRRSQDINITLRGDNTHINGDFILGGMSFFNDWGEVIQYENGYSENTSSYDESDRFTWTADVTLTIEGGTYALNPENYTYDMHIATEDENHKPLSFTQKGITIPSTHEVKTITMEGVANPLYRVVKKAARDGEDKLYDLNDNVQSQGDGQNPTTSFELSDGTAMTLNQPTTKAGYVEVSEGTTVTVATDQTLVINNGLDVQGTSVVTAQPGSALVIGEGGIVTKSSSSIVVEANQNGAASLLLDPAITVNQTPELTVKMTAHNVGKIGEDYFWHRFALPIDQVRADDGSWSKDGHSFGTLLYKWDYTNNKWASLQELDEMKPFYGYTLSLEENVANPGELKDAGYIFKGNLTGNVNSTLEFSRQGYNFFGNSYTGYISVLKLVDELIGNADIDGTVWMWDSEAQQYDDVPLNDLRNNPTAARYTGANQWKAEVAPMQTFILRLLTENTDATAEINYATAVWGNPRYDAVTGANNAPARQTVSTNDAYVRIVVTDANGKKDAVKFLEDANLSDAYDKGFDGAKYMNDNTINVYATVNGESYGTVATDNLAGKTISIRTNDAIAYTISFADVEGNEYALRDNATNQVIAIEEGATYEFYAQSNSTIEGRFEIIEPAKLPTAIENTEVKANVKGIYTLTGQYVGENFEALPAGVYVVNGVKIVK